jgi:hypothetical protein
MHNSLSYLRNVHSFSSPAGIGTVNRPQPELNHWPPFISGSGEECKCIVGIRTCCLPPSLYVHRTLPLYQCINSKKGKSVPVFKQLSTVPWKHIGEWRYSSIYLDAGTRWRSVVRFKPLLLYPRRNNIQSQSRRFALPGIEPGRPSRLYTDWAIPTPA